jgi:hypothetical protein
MKMSKRGVSNDNICRMVHFTAKGLTFDLPLSWMPWRMWWVHQKTDCMCAYFWPICYWLYLICTPNKKKNWEPCFVSSHISYPISSSIQYTIDTMFSRSGVSNMWPTTSICEAHKLILLEQKNAADHTTEWFISVLIYLLLVLFYFV